ncbi:MAG: WD40/YVTN/BNR-like repeat-containing protein [Bacillota bacterium]
MRARMTAVLLIVAVLLVPALGGCRRSSAGPVASATLPRQVHMLSATTGWGLNGPLVLRTTDGGSTWYDVTPKAGGTTVVGSDFADADHGWLAMAAEPGPLTIYRTADGGKSWSKTTPSVTTIGAQVQFADANHGWILIHEGVAAGSEGVALLRTQDGGASWTKVNETDPQHPTPGQLPFGGGKSGFGFSDDKNGWLTGYQPVDGRAYLFSTNDGGATWQPADLALPKDYAHSELSTRPPVFFSSADGLLPVVFFGPGQPTVFYVTHDGGKTWAPGAPLISTADNGLVWGFADIRHGFATDGLHLFATADGGSSWTEVQMNRSLAGVTQLSFVSDQVGWAASDTALLKTTDGGKTWAIVEPGK